MTAIAARLRILDELDAGARRAWGADVDRLPLEDYRDMILCLALDRIHRGETRGYTRRRPAQPAALDVTTLKVGVALE